MGEAGNVGRNGHYGGWTAELSGRHFLPGWFPSAPARWCVYIAEDILSGERPSHAKNCTDVQASLPGYDFGLADLLSSSNSVTTP